jgi:hypothetical protein
MPANPNIKTNAAKLIARVSNRRGRVHHKEAHMSRTSAQPNTPLCGQSSIRLHSNGRRYELHVCTPSEALESGNGYRIDHARRIVYIAQTDSAAEFLKRLSFAQDMLNFDTIGELQRHDEYNRRGYADYLARLSEAALPARHVVAFALSQVTQEVGWGEQAPIEKVDEAIALFDSLPVDERTRIQNGWASPVVNDRPDSSNIADCGDCEFMLERVLRLDVSPYREPSAVQTYELADDARVWPVRVLIGEGTSKREAILALENALDLIR